jgi:hypothetical protein
LDSPAGVGVPYQEPPPPPPPPLPEEELDEKPLLPDEELPEDTGGDEFDAAAEENPARLVL